jgi:hypothetical protein
MILLIIVEAILDAVIAVEIMKHSRPVNRERLTRIVFFITKATIVLSNTNAIFAPEIMTFESVWPLNSQIRTNSVRCQTQEEEKFQTFKSASKSRLNEDEFFNDFFRFEKSFELQSFRELFS